MQETISQGILDGFARAWSRLDRARPQTRAGLPRAVDALADWMRRAIDLDDLLPAVMGLGYVRARGDRSGGPPLIGLRHAWALVLHDHPLIELLLTTPGRDALHWDLSWAPFRALPRLPMDHRVAEQEEAYPAHLEDRAVRSSASSVTTPLLTLTHDARRAIPVE